MARTTVLWFRRDLRLADNPALAAAADEGDVVPLYVLDPVLLARAGAPRRAFLAASLHDLDRSIGGSLVVRRGDPVDVVARVADEVGAVQVMAAGDAGPYGRRRDAVVGEALAARDRVLRLVGTPYAVPPGTVRKGDGRPYAVFTPFSGAWRGTGWDLPIDAPDVTWRGRPTVPSEPLAGSDPGPGVELPPAGECAAQHRLAAFLAGGLARYDADRDRPGVDGTSRLSPYLRWGQLHPRQVLAHLGDERPHRVLRSELGWREFYADVLFHHPTTGWEDLDRRMGSMPVDSDAAARARFEAWAEGRTGFPIVDAGMRQLRAVGWMHNRVRMIVASFLVKDLHLPWQWGARHFMRHLVDGDLASNSHGWQWAAGTGTDAAPYFRVFNPVSQSERFDPEGTYLRRWVPELAGARDGEVHVPWRSRRGLPLGYPPPMVDHAVERAEALRRYAIVRERRAH